MVLRAVHRSKPHPAEVRGKFRSRPSHNSFGVTAPPAGHLVLGYRIGRYTLGGRAHYNTGRPYTAAPQTGYARLPSYGQIDLRCDRRFVLKNFTLELYAELQNATLSRQVLSVEYLGSQLANGTSYRIVLPSIGVHGEM